MQTSAQTRDFNAGLVGDRGTPSDVRAGGMTGVRAPDRACARKKKRREKSKEVTADANYHSYLNSAMNNVDKKNHQPHDSNVANIRTQREARDVGERGRKTVKRRKVAANPTTTHDQNPRMRK